MYYIKPASLKPETAAHENVTTDDGKCVSVASAVRLLTKMMAHAGRVDANPTAQAKDIREKAK